MELLWLLVNQIQGEPGEFCSCSSADATCSLVLGTGPATNSDGGVAHVLTFCGRRSRENNKKTS